MLGLTAVTGDGRILHVGGRVVKNVAGYDLVRLMVGSRGALGVITSVSLRLLPRPAVDRVLALRSDNAADLVAPARAVATARVLPASAEIVLAEEAGGAALVVRVVGGEARVEAESALLTAATDGALEPVEEEEARRLLEAARDAGSAGDIRIEMWVRPADVGPALGLARELREAIGPPSTTEGTLACGALSGAVRMGWWRVAAAGEEMREAALSRTIADARRRVEERGGTLTLLRAPPGVLREVGVYGSGRAVASLMRGIERALDPEGVLFPERFRA